MSKLTHGFDTDVRAPQAAPAEMMGEGLRAGCDPGKKGYIVVECPDGTLEAFSIPVDDEGNYDEDAILELAFALKAMGVRHVTLEAQQPARMRGSQKNMGMANNAVRASFMIGFGYALIRMALRAAGIKFDTAWPSAWKKAMGISPPKGTPEKEREKTRKQLTRDAATTEWPDHGFLPTPRSRVPNHDMCEAALLIRYGQKKGFTWD